MTHPAEDLIGKTLFRYEMPVEQGKIREFARATGADPAIYDGPDAPIPPTFLASSMFWEPADPPLVELLGVRLENVLQGGQDYRFVGPWITAGQTLSAATSVESVTRKEGRRGGAMILIVVLTEFRNGSGDVVAEARATVIEKVPA
ncbi:FAS1-like dehydratase domain-containing protein [Gordonia terrae]